MRTPLHLALRRLVRDVGIDPHGRGSEPGGLTRRQFLGRSLAAGAGLGAAAA